MKQQGKCIIGDPIRVGSFTADWLSVKLHPSTFYRRLEEFHDGLETSKGIYTELDLGQFILIRFSEKDDLTAFHRRHHAYL